MKRPREVARRELREETGYELEPGAELVSLGHYFTSPGFTDEHCYFFLARPVRQGRGGAAARRDRGDPRLPRIQRGRPAPDDRRRRNSRRQYAQHLGAAWRGAARIREFDPRLPVSIFQFRILPTNETARHFRLSRSARERDLEAVPRAPRGPALDDRENGDRADRRDVSLLRLSATAGRDPATAAERSRRPGRRLARARDHRLDHDLVSSRVLRRDRVLVSVSPLFSRAIRAARADRGRKALPLSRRSSSASGSS